MAEPFAETLLRWYETEGRQLPWRQTRDPYAIWVSEIILQQTRVAQGMDYYLRFMKRFPTVELLAAADEDEVLRLWQGLGYYSRARNMRRAAQQIVAMGGFPRDYQQIRSLCGIGDYTASAIASFAFDAPLAVVDGNVYRVLSRYFAIETPIDTTAGQREYKTLAQKLLPLSHPATYNQAIMDFGALQCTPQNPVCETCPLNTSCLALAQRKVSQLPRKAHSTKVRHRYFTYLFLFSPRRRVLLQRRPAGDIWQGLYQLPLIETETALSEDEVRRSVPALECRPVVSGLVHQLTHQRLHADCYLLRVASEDDVTIEGKWVELSSLDHYAMPRLLTTIMERAVTLCLP